MIKILLVLLNPWVSAVIVLALGLAYTLRIFRTNRWQSPRYAGFLPQFWTGLGILGTFIALFVQLGILGVDANDIPGLIKQLSSAFSTSVVGLFGSIVVSMYIRKRQFEQDQITEKQEWAKQAPEELLYKIMLSSLNVEEHLKSAWAEEKQLQTQGLIEQQVMFKQWGENLDTMTANMTNDFSRLLNGLEGSLGRKLNSLSDTTMQQWQAGINQMLGEFSEEGKRLLGENTETKKELLDNQRELTESISDTFLKLQESLKEYAKDSKDAIAVSSQEVAQKFNTSIKEMIEVHSGTLEGMFERMQEWQATSKQALEQTTTSFREAVNQYRDFKNEEEAVLQHIREQMTIWEQLLGNQSVLLTTVEQHHERIDGISAMMEDTAQAVSKLSEIKRYLAEISSNCNDQ